MLEMKIFVNVTYFENKNCWSSALDFFNLEKDKEIIYLILKF